MKKHLPIILLLLFSCILFAQENNDFQDYLSHCKEMQMPFDISIDSAKVFFYRRNSNIPLNYVRKYMCPLDKVNRNDTNEYDYFYGIRINLGKYVAVIGSKYCDECGSKYGLGIGYYPMIIHSLDGKIVSQKTIALGSDQHFYFGQFTEGRDSRTLLSLFIKRGTLSYYDKTNRIYQGIYDYYTYTVSDTGVIEERKQKTTHIEMSRTTERIKILKEW